MATSHKIINTKLDANLLFKYEHIKENLGIQNDAEVIRYLIAQFFHANFNEEQKQAHKDFDTALPMINEFMARYGEEWKKLGG